MVQPGQDPSSSPRSVERLHGALSSKLNGQTASAARPLAFLPPCSPPPLRPATPFHTYSGAKASSRICAILTGRWSSAKNVAAIGAAAKAAPRGMLLLQGSGWRGDRARHSGKALKSLDIPVQKCLFLLFTLMRSAINRRRLPSTRAYIPCLYPTWVALFVCLPVCSV